MRILNGRVVEKRYGTDGSVTYVNYAEVYGLSTDTKPTSGFCSGSRLTEVDTGKVYLYDETSGAWLQSTGTSVSGATVTLGSSLTYTGQELTQAVSTVKVGSTTLTSGTDYEVTRNKATNAGSYTLYIVGKGSYCGLASKAFTVAKAQGTITGDPDSMSLTYGGEADESELTVTGDGAVTVLSSDTDVATAAVADGIVTVTPVGAGSATVTVTLAAGDNYLGATETISVTVAKAEGSVTAAPDTLALTAGDDGESTLSVVGDGDVTVASSDSDVATAAVEDGVVTVTAVAAGTATVTVTLAAGDNYLGASDTISVTVTAAE